MRLQDGCTFEDIIEDLNNRAFFWPGTEHGPNDHGRRHFARYANERPLLIRAATSELIAANKHYKGRIKKSHLASFAEILRDMAMRTASS
jgi:hypothetical protein